MWSRYYIICCRPPIIRGGKIIMCCGYIFPTKHYTLTPVDMQWRDSSQFIVQSSHFTHSFFTLHSSDFIPHSSDFTLHSLYFTLHTSQFKLHTSQFTVHTSYFTDQTSQFILHTSQFAQQYFSHIRTTEGWTWKALCNEAPFRLGPNLASRGIRTRDPAIRSRVR